MGLLGGCEGRSLKRKIRNLANKLATYWLAVLQHDERVNGNEDRDTARVGGDGLGLAVRLVRLCADGLGLNVGVLDAVVKACRDERVTLDSERSGLVRVGGALEGCTDAGLCAPCDCTRSRGVKLSPL